MPCGFRTPYSTFQPQLQLAAQDDDLLASDPLRRLLSRTGWSLAGYADGAGRFLAVAERVSPRP